jgi:tetratricopeptide (TPR) repeat protein
MKIIFVFCLLASSYVFALWKYGGLNTSVVLKWSEQLEYEKKSLALARENRILQAKISDLKFQVSELQSKNKFFSAQLEKSRLPVAPAREIASIPKPQVEDLVNFEVYKWTPEKLLAISEKELHFKNYEKSAQFYNELISRFPKHEILSDRVLFGAGVAAFETGQRYDWSAKHFKTVVEKYPKSKLYRGAKLWLALSLYHQGEHQDFLKTAEEFRLKYRNTDEWKILSRYYEDITYKVKN